jgi:hypothetical protein
MKVYNNIGRILILLSLMSCTRVKELPLARYTVWVNDPQNGLVKMKDIGGYTLKAKFLPKEFLQLRDRNLPTDTAMDKYYKNTLTLSVSIAINKEMHQKYGGDIMKTNIDSYNDYKARIYEANFDIKENIFIKVGDEQIHPVLTNLENTQGLSPGITFMCVFPYPNAKTLDKDIDLTFDDELFGTGPNHFKFYKKDLTEIPVPI